MLSRLLHLIRQRWHPLWRLRRLPAFRWFQEQFDLTVSTRLPETDLRVAVRLLRDASWIASPRSLEPAIRATLLLVLDAVQPRVFWDVGANIGFYSWLIRRHPSVQQVLMFEPDPENFALISQTIAQNCITDCRALSLALSDTTGEAAFLRDAASGATGSLQATAAPEAEHSLHHSYQLREIISCRTETIDRLLAAGAPHPDLLKIDVEGAEHLVLRGGREFFTQHHPALIIETANPSLIAELRALGYLALRIDAENLLFIAESMGAALAPLRRHLAEVPVAARPAAAA